MSHALYDLINILVLCGLALVALYVVLILVAVGIAWVLQWWQGDDEIERHKSDEEPYL